MTGPVAAPDFTKAQRHLARRDKHLKKVITSVGPCTLWFQPDRFAVLVRAIVSQQISGKAAASISSRLEQALGGAGFKPERILAATDTTLRGAGLSAGKVRSLRDLAEKVHKGTVPLQQLHELSDEEAIKRLVVVHGIGPWTAQMFLIFSLGRLDVLPTADLGLRVGVQRLYGLKEPPKPAKLEVVARPWQPYRTIATWYMWRSLGGVPQSG
jgi:DNA-3-methyladenine glycosylase II